MRYMLQGLFHKKQTGNEFGASSRPAPDEKGQGCCELNEIVMNRLSQIEFKQLFCTLVILLWGGRLKIKTLKGTEVDFDTFNNENVGHGGTDFEAPFEDVIGSRAEDVEVGREVGGEEPKKYLFEGTFVSKHMFDVLNFCPSFDLGIDDELNANDIELDNMEFTELDLKMIDECVQMGYLSTSKNEESMIVLSTPDIPRKRLRKAVAVFRSPYTSNFGSSAKTKVIVREIRTGTYALSDELNDVAIDDVVDFEEWYILGLSKKNKKKRFDDKNEILNPPFDFGILEVANKKWFYDLRTP
ncbi:Uncharacterized protein Adt_05635 [Abeliophyllum distichum]|uniref:Uncharacterized protein n=1 Tax=Abeliophyllum distichum TaxID=126358 RepID=A0ABD1V4M3_9LAMI